MELFAVPVLLVGTNCSVCYHDRLSSFASPSGGRLRSLAFLSPKQYNRCSLRNFKLANEKRSVRFLFLSLMVFLSSRASPSITHTRVAIKRMTVAADDAEPHINDVHTGMCGCVIARKTRIFNSPTQPINNRHTGGRAKRRLQSHNLLGNHTANIIT